MNIDDNIIIKLNAFRTTDTYVIGSSLPIDKANYLDVNFSKSRLPITEPIVFATVDTVLIKWGTFNYFNAKLSKEISWRLIANIPPTKNKANV